MTGTIIQILQFFASLSLLVLIHEFGHFITARMFGIRVDKFYLFFNPWFSLFKFKRKGIEYGIGWIPLGGYVSLYDSREKLMIEEEEIENRRKKAAKQGLTAEAEALAKQVEELREQQRTLPAEKDELRGKPAWQRLIVMIAGVVMNALLAVGIYAGMLFTWGEQYYHNDDMVNGYIFNDEAKALGFVDGDRIVSIDGEAIGNVSEINERLLIVDHDLSVELLRSGESVAITLPLEELVAMRERGGYKNFFGEYIPFVISSVERDTATEAGIMPGDKVVAINGTTVADFINAVPMLSAAKSTNVEIDVARGEEIVTLSVPVDENGTIGVRVNNVQPRSYEYSFWESIPAGFREAGNQIASYWNQLVMMFNPDTKLYKEMGGFIAIGSIFPEVWSWPNFWSITALLSVILAVMNLLPIPVLDGGHVIFTLWELITGHKPSERFMVIAQNIGFYLLIALMIYANGSDILRLFN